MRQWTGCLTRTSPMESAQVCVCHSHAPCGLVVLLPMHGWAELLQDHWCPRHLRDMVKTHVCSSAFSTSCPHSLRVLPVRPSAASLSCFHMYSRLPLKCQCWKITLQIALGKLHWAAVTGRDKSQDYEYTGNDQVMQAAVGRPQGLKRSCAIRHQKLELAWLFIS